jgi:pectate lyase
MTSARHVVGAGLFPFLFVLGATACSGSDDGGDAVAVGGDAGIGGQIGTGGSVGSSSTVASSAGNTSAMSGAGGKSAVGSVGGGDAKGGASGLGGAAASGGKTSAGGASAAGGKTSAGGASAAGGKTSAGGASAAGGKTSAGGTSASGGKTSAGGTCAAGGNTGNCSIPTPSTSPIGYGSQATGGGSKAPVEVNSMAGLVSALAAYKKGTSGLVIRYTGKFDFSTIKDPCEQFKKEEQTVDVKEMSNVTIIGAPGSSVNFGLHFSKVSNVIVRNMTFGLIPGKGDALGIEGESSNIWIDHNEFFSSMVECAGAGDLEFDGLLDMKDGSHHMTFSYNYFHDHHKVGLMGSSDSDLGDRFVTLHHNRYENVGSRTPLQRGGTTHIYNNYYNKIGVSGINVRMGGIALIESNYFENSKNPVTSRDSSSIGYWDLRNNFVGAGITWSAGDAPFANATDWKTSKAFTASLGYSYTADPAACVKAIVTATAGAKL